MSTLRRLLFSLLIIVVVYVLVRYFFSVSLFSFLYHFIYYGLPLSVVAFLFIIPQRPLFGITNKVVIVFLHGFFAMAIFVATGFLSPLLYTLSQNEKTQKSRVEEFFSQYAQAMNEGDVSTARRIFGIYKKKNFKFDFNDSGFYIDSLVQADNEDTSEDNRENEAIGETFIQRYSLEEFGNLHEEKLSYLIESLYTDKQFFSALFLVNFAKQRGFSNTRILRAETKIYNALVLPSDSRDKKLELFILRQLNIIIPKLAQINTDNKEIIANYYALLALQRNIGNYDFDWVIHAYEEYLETFVYYADDAQVSFLSKDIAKPILFSNYVGGNIIVVFFALDTVKTNRGIFYDDLTIFAYNFSDNIVLGEYFFDHAFLKDTKLYTRSIRRADGIVESEGQVILHTSESTIPDVSQHWVISLDPTVVHDTTYSVINDDFYRGMTFDQLITNLSAHNLERHALVSLYYNISKQAILPFLIFFCLLSCSTQCRHRNVRLRKHRYLALIATTLAVNVVHVFLISAMQNVIGFHVYTNSEVYLFSFTTTVCMIFTLLTTHNFFRQKHSLNTL